MAQEVGRKLVDQDDPDDGHFIEKILDHRDDDEDGGRENKVRSWVTGSIRIYGKEKQEFWDLLTFVQRGGC